MLSNYYRAFVIDMYQNIGFSKHLILFYLENIRNRDVEFVPPCEVLKKDGNYYFVC